MSLKKEFIRCIKERTGFIKINPICTVVFYTLDCEHNKNLYVCANLKNWAGVVSSYEWIKARTYHEFINELSGIIEKFCNDTTEKYIKSLKSGYHY